MLKAQVLRLGLYLHTGLSSAELGSLTPLDLCPQTQSVLFQRHKSADLSFTLHKGLSSAELSLTHTLDLCPQTQSALPTETAVILQTPRCQLP